MILMILSELRSLNLMWETANPCILCDLFFMMCKNILCVSGHTHTSMQSIKILKQFCHSADRAACWAAVQTLAIEGKVSPAIIRGLVEFMPASRMSVQQRAIHLLSQLSKISVSGV